MIKDRLIQNFLSIINDTVMSNNHNIEINLSNLYFPTNFQSHQSLLSPKVLPDDNEQEKVPVTVLPLVKIIL